MATAANLTGSHASPHGENDCLSAYLGRRVPSLRQMEENRRRRYICCHSVPKSEESMCAMVEARGKLAQANKMMGGSAVSCPMRRL